MSEKANHRNPENLSVQCSTPADLGGEIRELAAAVPGLKPGTVAVMAMRAGLPLVRAQIIDGAAKLAADDQ